MFEAQLFRQKIPAKVIELIEALAERDLVVTIVGGAVRDHLEGESSLKDFDIEVSLGKLVDEKEWVELFKKKVSEAADQLSLNYKELSFSIFQFTLDENIQIEISMPRLELYPTSREKGHSDFSVQFVSDGELKERFKRRDFTLNAIGVEIRKDSPWQLCDPFNGIKDLKEKKLRSANPDFYLDPVRLLRAIRFQHKLGAEICLEEIKKFDLQKLSFFYLRKEALKSDFALFLKNVFSLIKEYQIPAPSWMGGIEETEKVKFFDQTKNFRELYLLCIFEEEDQLTEHIGKLIQVKKKYSLKLFKLASQLRESHDSHLVHETYSKCGFELDEFPKDHPLTQVLEKSLR